MSQRRMRLPLQLRPLALAWMPALGAALAGPGLAALAAPATAAEPPAPAAAASAPARAPSSRVVVKGKAILTVSPKATYTQSVISEETIRNLSPAPTVTIQTLLAQQPSVFVYANGPTGVETNVYLRSFNSSQFSETFAGVALNDLFNGGVTNSAENRNNVLLIPSNIQGVDVYRGINNPSVNSYNSLGGTVDFTPRQPDAVAGGAAGVSAGNYGTFGVHARYDTGDWHGLKQVLALTHTSSRGWIDHTADHNNNFYWGLTYAFGPTAHLANYLLYNDNRGLSPYNMPAPLQQQYGRSYQWPLNYTSAPIHDTNWMDIVDFSAALSHDVVLRNKFFFGRNEYLRTSYSNPAFQQSATQPYTLEDTPTGFPFWLSNAAGPTYDPVATFGASDVGTAYHFYGYTTSGVGDSPSLHISLPGNDIVLGANLTSGKLHSREYWYGSAPVPQVTGYNNAWDEHDSRTLWSAYAQDTVSLLDDRLLLTPGVKFIHARTTDSDAVGFYYPLAGSVSDSEHFVSPTLGANFKVADSLHVYASYGKNIKLPDISAYYGAFQTDANGNPTIVPPQVKPEYVQDYELGARYQAGGLSVALNAYRENFSNTFITRTDPTTQLSTTTNGGGARYQGLELQLAQDFGAGPAGDFSGYLNLAHNQAKFTSSFTSDFAGTVTAGQPLAGVPERLVSAGLVWKLAGWRANVDARYVGRQYIDQAYAGVPSAATIAAYTVVNLGLSDTIELPASGPLRTVRLGLNLDNVFNRQYLNTAFTDTDYFGNAFVRGVVAPPRLVTGSVDVTF
ncbi:MAG: TonB-dependent receptor [Burkholderiales bacterium]|nr:TonB-dependent receptor [Burkholderiales bacterium]